MGVGGNIPKVYYVDVLVLGIYYVDVLVLGIYSFHTKVLSATLSCFLSLV